jgi:predicted oxidoreductase
VPRVADTDVVVVGVRAWPGLVATAELADAGKRVVLLEQEPEASFGGQAWWSFGGLFLVDSPEQRRLRVRDSLELARQDWFGTAAFDRGEGPLAAQWARPTCIRGGRSAWLRSRASASSRRRLGRARRLHARHGNFVPRFHSLGHRPGLVEPFGAGCAQRERRR